MAAIINPQGKASPPPIARTAAGAVAPTAKLLQGTPAAAPIDPATAVGVSAISNAAPPFVIEEATEKDRYLKLFVYGGYGTGKTTLVSTACEVKEMEDVLMIDAEAGDLTISQFEGLDVVHINTYKSFGLVLEYLRVHCRYRDMGTPEAEQKLRELQTKLRRGDPGDKIRRYRTVIIDSLSEVETYCIAENTWVQLKEGFCRIQDHPDAIFQGVKKTIEVRTNRGQTLTCTPDHNILTAEGQWVPAEQLKSGTTLVSGCHIQPLSDPIADPLYWWVLGYWLGDGSLRQDAPGNLIFAIGKGEDREFLETKLNSFCWNQYDEKLRSPPSQREKGFIYATRQHRLVEDIRQLFGMEGQQKYYKNLFVPLDKIKNIPAFLQGLFDADGCASISNGCVTLSSKSEVLLQDVQLALWSLDIYSSIYPCEGMHTTYALRIYDNYSLMRFQERVGFSIPSKKSRLTSLANTCSRANRSAPYVKEVVEGDEVAVYDLINQPNQQFAANGLIVHNCMYQLLGITDRTRIDEEVASAEFSEYKRNHNMVLRAVRAYRDLPMNVLFTSAAQQVQDDRKRFVYQPALTGKLAKQIQGFMDMVGFLVVSPNATEETAPRRLYVQPSERFDAKNRFRGFKPLYFENPTVNTILSSVGLLEKMRQVKANPPSATATATPATVAVDAASPRALVTPVEAQPAPDAPAVEVAATATTTTVTPSTPPNVPA
jgi:predicted DNA-binding protein